MSGKNFTIFLVLLLCLFAVFLPATSANVTGLPIPGDFELVTSAKGVTLYQKQGVEEYMQIINLTQGAKVKLQHGPIDRLGAGEGDYGGASPWFFRQSLTQAWNEVASAYPDAVCITNGQFFGTAFQPAQLSFPLKKDGEVGEVLSEGSDHAPFLNQLLMLELWPSRANITTLSEDALYTSTAPDIIAGLTEDAPKEPEQPIGRTFVGVADDDGDGWYEIVLIYSAKAATQAHAAQTLRDFGADKVMMLDGGGSTQLICDNESLIHSSRTIPQTVAAIGSSVKNVSVALIIDASGSMSWNDPDNMRRAGAQAFVDSTQPGDKIAVVAFSTEAHVVAPLTIISSANDRIVLKSLIDQIGAEGWTDVNGGLNDGFSELSSDTSNNHKAAVMLTDGEHNVDPYDPQSHLQYADEGWPIYTIGLGDADLVLLNEIASETGGKCWNDCTVLTTPSDLATLYTEILADLAGANTLLSTRIQLAQGETQELMAGLPPTQSGATFFISWPGSEVSLSLVSPSCRHINPATVAADVYHAKGSTYEIYTILHPEPGQWRLEVYGTDIPAGGTEVDVRIFSRGNKFLYLPLIYENYGSTTAGNTNVIATTEANFTPRDVTSVSCPLPPQAPANLQATPIDISRIQLTWDDNADNEAGFSIYEGNTLVATVERNSTSHIVEGLGINSHHCYRIQAFNNYGNSLWSNDACAATDSLPLTGTVTDNDVPVAGTGVRLLFYDGTSYSTYATTTTDANGNYQFTNFPSLNNNQWLIVHWFNSSGNVSRLSRWYCRAITWLTIDPTAYICNFDLENMDMLLPAHGQTVTLPYTFTWDKRILTSDNYRLSLADVNNNYDPWWLTSSLGHVDSYTMNGLPSGFVPNKNYGWWLYVFGPDGYGLSRYYYVVKFSNTGTTVLESTPLPAFLLEEEIDLLVPFETP